MYIVLDSNILLHYISFEEIPWQEEFGCGEVTIVLTGMVLEEIDKKKDDEIHHTGCIDYCTDCHDNRHIYIH